MKLPGRILAAIVAGILLVLPVAVPAQATDSVIDAAPEIASVEAPAPGHSSTWSMSVTNRTDRRLPVGLVVQGADGLLTSGPAPLLVSVSSSDGGQVIDATPAGELLPATVELEPLAPGETRELRGEATLPRAADDRYQGADGRLTFRFTALAGDPAPGASTLRRTGGDLMGGAALLGALLVSGTALVIIGRRRRSQHG